MAVCRRYHIRAGATTTAGGIVRASSDFCKVNGAPLARDGDPVDCLACGTQGVIKCVEPRLSHTFEGKEYALSDDLCICKCSPSPKLVTDQTFKFQTFLLAAVESAAEAAARSVSANAEKLLPLRFTDEETGQPHSNRAYRIHLPNSVIEGVTNADGLSKPLTKAEREAMIAWNILPEPAPARDA
ncbi:MAG: PAAR domain-containing protein [Telluria sp.]